MSSDQIEAAAATPAEPSTAADSLRLVRLRLYLTLTAAAILPMALGSPLIRVLTGGTGGVQPVHIVALVVLGALLMVLIRWMTREILLPAAELEASRSELHQAYREAREHALIDGLTGLGNHRAFQEEFKALLDQAQRYRHDLSLVLLDLDEFKLVNDSQGHAVGDMVLAEVGRLLRQQTRLADRAFRIGGDEFAILLPHTGSAGAAQLARRILAAGLEVRPAAAYPRPISFSAGVASCPAHAATREQLRLYADSAMYRGKRAGRTTVTIADPAIDAEHVDEQKRAELSSALAQVIEDRALRPVYQPVVHLETGRIIGYEGLIRPTSEAPFANPGALFAAAEISGHVVDLDLACLAVALAGARAIPDPLLVTLNVSPRTLEAPEFGAARLLRMVHAAGLPADRVILEVTERDVINDVPRVLAALEGCRAGGIRIAVDDVGAGNAGLRLLSQFRFDVVKIDLSLVQAGTGQETVRSVLGTLVDLAGRWGALLVAEGVETPAQLALVRELAIGAGQGYLLGRPGTAVDLGAVDIEALLQPSTNPYVRLGLEGFTVEGGADGKVGASAWQLPVSTSWPGTTTVAPVAGS
jgi:diguanylate cyclase (GGDEF)-like protein